MFLRLCTSCAMDLQERWAIKARQEPIFLWL